MKVVVTGGSGFSGSHQVRRPLEKGKEVGMVRGSVTDQKLLGETAKGYRVDRFRQVRAFSIEKARRELGYNPTVGIEEGLSRTYRWYRDNGYL